MDIKENEKSKKRIETVETKVEKMEKAMTVMLHDRFFQSCLYNLKRGYTTNVDLENINYLWKYYHEKYGMNGYGQTLYNKVQELDVHVNKYL